MSHRRTSRHAPTKLDTGLFRLGASAAIAAVVVALFGVAMTENGMLMLGRVVAFLEFYAGAFALIMFTATVGLGLLTTEKVFLAPANRVRAQFAHRATAAIGVGYLILHVVLMITLNHVPVTSILLPTAGIFVFLGTVAGHLMIGIVVTGIIRGRFAVSKNPWVWRSMHAGAYISWPISILHGLTAGRPAAEWVTWSYVALMAAVGAALLVRILATMLRPAIVPETVEGPAVSDAPAVPEPVNAPVSLADARRKYREAG